MKRIAAIVLGLFSLICLVEMPFALKSFINYTIPRFIIYQNINAEGASKLYSYYLVFGSEFITCILHFIVFLVGFIIVIKNMIKTHHIHGDLELAEHEHDYHHIFPQLFSVIALSAGIVSCCFKIMNKADISTEFIIKTIVSTIIFTALPCVFMLLFARTKHNDKKWLIISSVIIFILYKALTLIPFTAEILGEYFKFTVSNSVSSWYLVVGYTLLLIALFKGVDCHKTLKLMLTVLVIITAVPYRTIIFSENTQSFIYSMYGLLTSVYLPLSLDLLVHKALPEREIKNEQKV